MVPPEVSEDGARLRAPRVSMAILSELNGLDATARVVAPAGVDCAQLVGGGPGAANTRGSCLIMAGAGGQGRLSMLPAKKPVPMDHLNGLDVLAPVRPGVPNDLMGAGFRARKSILAASGLAVGAASGLVGGSNA